MTLPSHHTIPHVITYLFFTLGQWPLLLLILWVKKHPSRGTVTGVFSTSTSNTLKQADCMVALIFTAHLYYWVWRLSWQFSILDSLRGSCQVRSGQLAGQSSTVTHIVSKPVSSSLTLWVVARSHKKKESASWNSWSAFTARWQHSGLGSGIILVAFVTKIQTVPVVKCSLGAQPITERHIMLDTVARKYFVCC